MKRSSATRTRTARLALSSTCRAWLIRVWSAGFGTKSSKKSKKAADEFDEDEMEEGDTPAGGGVDAVEEQDLMEEEQEMQDEDR